VSPIDLAGLRVEAVQEPGEVRGVNKTLGRDETGGDRAVHVLGLLDLSIVIEVEGFVFPDHVRVGVGLALARLAADVDRSVCGGGVVGVHPGVAGRRYYQRLALDGDDRRAGPLAVKDVAARGVVGPLHFAGVLVEADDRGGERGDDVLVRVVHSVGGDRVDV